MATRRAALACLFASLITPALADWHASADGSTYIAFSDSTELTSGTERMVAKASVSFIRELECAPVFALINEFPANPRQKTSTATTPFPMQLYVDGKQQGAWSTTVTSTNNRTVVLVNDLTGPALIALAKGNVVKIVIDNDPSAFAMFKLTGSKAAISEALTGCLTTEQPHVHIP
jgi:hypothetical protein